MAPPLPPSPMMVTTIGVRSADISIHVLGDGVGDAPLFRLQARLGRGGVHEADHGTAASSPPASSRGPPCGSPRAGRCRSCGTAAPSRPGPSGGRRPPPRCPSSGGQSGHDRGVVAEAPVAVQLDEVARTWRRCSPACRAGPGDGRAARYPMAVSIVKTSRVTCSCRALERRSTCASSRARRSSLMLGGGQQALHFLDVRVHLAQLPVEVEATYPSARPSSSACRSPSSERMRSRRTSSGRNSSRLTTVSIIPCWCWNSVV